MYTEVLFRITDLRAHRLEKDENKMERLELEDAFDLVLTKLPKFKNSFLRGDFDKELVGGIEGGTLLMLYLFKLVCYSLQR